MLFYMNLKVCKVYLVPYMMTFVAWKQSYSRFSEQLDFSGSEIICIFRLLKFVRIMQANF